MTTHAILPARKKHSHFFGVHDKETRSPRRTRLFCQWCAIRLPSRRVTWSRCASALCQAARSSERGEKDSSLKWLAAKAACRRNDFAFEKAVDIPLDSGQTALQRLSRTRDHQALHFVHSNVPPGVYLGNIHLGRHCARDPFKPLSFWSVDGAPTQFGYWGQMGAYKFDFQGFGALVWKNGNTYIGEFCTVFEFAVQPANIKTTFTLHEPDEDNLRFEYTLGWLGVKATPYRASSA